MSASPSPCDDCVYSVVGQHRDDPAVLLRLGEDGRHYRLDPAAGDPEPVDPGGEWVLDPDPASTADAA